MKLYTHPLSGHSHRAHLFLSLADVAHTLEVVDLSKGAHKAPEFLEKNAFGQVPVLELGPGEHLADSNAIMVYVALERGLERWYPSAPRAAAEVQRWLSVAAGQVAFGPAAARLITVFGAGYDPDVVIPRAHALYRVLDARLAGREWIASAGHPTVADVALYSYTASAPEGNVDLSEYPEVRAWLERVEALPGFVPFTQTPVGLAAAE